MVIKAEGSLKSISLWLLKRSEEANRTPLWYFSVRGWICEECFLARGMFSLLYWLCCLTEPNYQSSNPFMKTQKILITVEILSFMSTPAFCALRMIFLLGMVILLLNCAMVWKAASTRHKICRSAALKLIETNSNRFWYCSKLLFCLQNITSWSTRIWDRIHDPYHNKNKNLKKTENGDDRWRKSVSFGSSKTLFHLFYLVLSKSKNIPRFRSSVSPVWLFWFLFLLSLPASSLLPASSFFLLPSPFFLLPSDSNSRQLTASGSSSIVCTNCNPFQRVTV